MVIVYPSQKNYSTSEPEKNDTVEVKIQTQSSAVSSQIFDVVPIQRIRSKTHPNFKLLPSLEQCGVSVLIGKIVGGEDAPHAGHPWMARIAYKSKSQYTFLFISL